MYSPKTYATSRPRKSPLSVSPEKDKLTLTRNQADRKASCTQSGLVHVRGCHIADLKQRGHASMKLSVVGLNITAAILIAALSIPQSQAANCSISLNNKIGDTITVEGYLIT